MECSRVEMLKKIQCSNFAAYDMLLYLDTHSDDKKAFRKIRPAKPVFNRYAG